MRIWLGGIGNEELLININRRFSVGDFEPRTIEQRTASGKLVRDIGPVKKRFSLDYRITTDEVLAQLARLYALGRSSSLSLRVEESNGSVSQYIVFFRPFARSRHLLAGQWLWENIGVELEEV